MPLPDDIEAEIYYLTAEEGGRKTPIFTGYRGQFYYNGNDWDAPQKFKDVEFVNPGGTVRACIGFVSPNKHHGQISVGMKFEVREGTRTVGKGTVTKILDLPNSAKRASELKNANKQ